MAATYRRDERLQTLYRCRDEWLRPKAHADVDDEDVAWASGNRSARDPQGKVIPLDQRSCVSVAVITPA